MKKTYIKYIGISHYICKEKKRSAIKLIYMQKLGNFLWELESNIFRHPVRHSRLKSGKKCYLKGSHTDGLKG